VHVKLFLQTNHHTIHGTYSINKPIKSAKFNNSASHNHSHNFTNAPFNFFEQIHRAA